MHIFATEKDLLDTNSNEPCTVRPNFSPGLWAGTLANVAPWLLRRSTLLTVRGKEHTHWDSQHTQRFAWNSFAICSDVKGFERCFKLQCHVLDTSEKCTGNRLGSQASIAKMSSLRAANQRIASYLAFQKKNRINQKKSMCMLAINCSNHTIPCILPYCTQPPLCGQDQPSPCGAMALAKGHSGLSFGSG